MSEAIVKSAFAGKTEMHGLTRNFDWANSPVGPIDQWSPSLKTAVSICLESMFPIWILWGRRELTTFYNDAYRPMLGRLKHPQFLGRSGKACWSELWDVVGASIDQVFVSGASVRGERQLLIMERNGFLEETYFTYSYSAIKNPDGEVGGMFCACHEDTKEVLGARRLASLRRLTGMPETKEQAAVLACESFASNAHDIPFSLIYEVQEAHSPLRYLASSGIKEEGICAPPTLELRSSQDVFRLFTVVRQRKPLLIEKVQNLDCFERQPWKETPESAYAVPIFCANQKDLEAIIVFGISSRLLFDEEYKSYLESVANHVGTLMAAARSIKDGITRSEQLAEVAQFKNDLAAQLEVQVHERSQEVLKTSAELRALAKLVSEQVQEPAVIISSYLKLLAVRYKGRLGEDADEFIEKCSAASTTVSHMVDDLWHYLRVDNADMAFTSIDVSERIDRASRGLDELLESSGATLLMPDSTPNLTANAAQIEHLFANLIHNAIRFSRLGVAPEIKITCQSLDSEILFRVTDNGVGIDSMHRGDIFKPFVRINARPDSTGTGMGLAIAEKIVHAHKGRIWVESSGDDGSTFCFTLAKNPA
ncbi:MAG: ATP-binding protein [Candidatus Obscuribacterales bacterium]|nr:ATP-binding protein [Candidatus Obscuribacterales bacterium]